MIKIVTVCGAGVGSSMMLKVYASEIIEAEGIEAKVDSSDVSSINPSEPDILITTSDFSDVLRNVEAEVIRIDNLTDKEQLKEKLLPAIKKLTN